MATFSLVYLFLAKYTLPKDPDPSFDIISYFWEGLSLFSSINNLFDIDIYDSPSDKNDFFPLTDNMETLRSQITTVRAYGGGDGPEDWVEGYKLATNNMAWREGTKLIIHIADDGAHGTEFSPGDRHPEQGPLLPPYIKKCVEKNIKIIGFKIGSSPSNSFNKIKTI